MATLTWKQRIIVYLETLGYHQNYEGPQSRKYVKYSIPGYTQAYHLGKAGAVLTSKDGKLVNAFSVTDQMKKRVQLFEQENTK